MAVNSDMLVLARQARGMTQEELAEAIGTPQSYVSKIEGGLLVVPDAALDKIAGELKFPPEFFLLPDEVRGVGSACNYHRKRESLARIDWYRITARLNLLRIHVTRLLRGVEVAAAHQFHSFDLEQFGTPQRVATLVRQTWKLPPGPVKSVIRAIEDAGGIVFMMPFGTDKIDAISQSLPGQPPLFLVNVTIPGDRLRFTLSHEIGHIIMHGLPTDDMEKEADIFAAEFLMPADDIRDDLCRFSLQKAASTLKPYWKVAISALMRRAKDLRVITERDYVNMCKRMSYLGYRKNEPVPIPPEQPTILKTIIQTHCDNLRYSTEELAKLVCMHRAEFEREYLDTGSRVLRIA